MKDCIEEIEKREGQRPNLFLMVLMVTGFSTVIHIYSAAYMEGEEYYNRYFTWLNLFVLMMLILVLGDNFLTMFVGWEGVGLCSYLLIGFWFDEWKNADAARNQARGALDLGLFEVGSGSYRFRGRRARR